MQKRDDMEIIHYTYQGVTYCYRLLDTNIKTYDEGKHLNFIVNVWEKDNHDNQFIVTFRLSCDDIHLACSKTEEAIRKHVEEK